MSGLPPWAALTPGGWNYAAMLGSFSPNDLGPALWLASDKGVYSDAGTTLAVDDDPVQQWQDQSGNDRHANQATEGNRPLWKDGVLNDHPVIRLDGVDDSLASTFGATLSQPNTILIVAKAVAITDGDWFLDGVDSGNRHAFGPRTSGLWQTYAGNTRAGGTNDTAFHVFTLAYNGASSSLRQDGALSFADDFGSQSLTGLRLGARFDGAQSHLQCDIAEVILYDSDLSGTDRDAVESYLATKYGITLA